MKQHSYHHKELTQANTEVAADNFRLLEENESLRSALEESERQRDEAQQYAAGCDAESGSRGIDVIRLGREVVNLRTQLAESVEINEMYRAGAGEIAIALGLAATATHKHILSKIAESQAEKQKLVGTLETRAAREMKMLEEAVATTRRDVWQAAKQIANTCLQEHHHHHSRNDDEVSSNPASCIYFAMAEQSEDKNSGETKPKNPSS